MGRMKDMLLEKEEEDWVEHWRNKHIMADINKTSIIYNDLFNMDDLEDFHMMEIHMDDGNTYYIYPEQIEEITGVNIKWTEYAQLHKGTDMKQVVALMSIPITHITCMTVYYADE